jgi:dihydrolipoamide dehydrogenase
VTIVDGNPHLLGRLAPEAGEMLAERLSDEGIDIRSDTTVKRVESTGDGVQLDLEGGGRIEASRLLVATGRTPNVEGFGLEQLGLEITERGITVDERLRAAEDVWAIGDVSGVALLTHVGKYQARVAAANVSGEDERADYRAIPASVFTDPQVGSVGRTEGDDVVSASYEIAGGRLSTYERPKRPGLVKLAADPVRRVLVGAVTVGPEAGEWLGQLTLAVKAEVPLEVLLDTIQPYPTFSEAIFSALVELRDALAA